MNRGLGEYAWVFIMKSDAERSWSANRGYDDSAGIYYSYDSNVARHQMVSAGDLIVVRVDEYIAGWGIVEHIEATLDADKEITRCPACRKTNHYRRKVARPSNKCSSCGCMFDDDEATKTIEKVTSYRAYYANTWTEAARPVHRRELGPILEKNDSFNAIRPLDKNVLPKFLEKISGRDIDLKIDICDEEIGIILGGHTTATVRRRRGQREFRFSMMERFGEICAFSGVQPPQVLEAAHLYSFAKRPEHHANGGLLLRRDFHALFDAKLITVNPNSWEVEVAPRIKQFRSYAELDRSPLAVEVSKRPDQELIAEHYEQSKRVFIHN